MRLRDVTLVILLPVLVYELLVSWLLSLPLWSVVPLLGGGSLVAWAAVELAGHLSYYGWRRKGRRGR
jgi:hypothetical protein